MKSMANIAGEKFNRTNTTKSPKISKTGDIHPKTRPMVSDELFISAGIRC